MDLLKIISSGTFGLQAMQNQLQTRATNIASAQDLQYVRRDPLSVSTTNRSVEAVIQRAVNDELHTAALDANSLAAAAQTTNDYYTKLGDILGTAQDKPYLQAALDNFTGAWQAYETNSDIITNEADVVNTGQALAAVMATAAQQLNKVDFETRADVGTTVKDLNSKLSSLDLINKKISSQAAGVPKIPELYDQQDALIRDISTIVGVTRIQHGDGTVALYTKTGTALVDKTATQFQWNNAIGQPVWISLAPPAQIGTAPGMNAAFSVGKLGAALRFLDSTPNGVASADPNVGTLAKARMQYDIIAAQLADNVVAPTAAQPQDNTFGGAYYYAQSDRSSDLMGGPVAGWPGPPPTLSTTKLTAVAPTPVTTPMSSFFTVDNGQAGPPPVAPTLSTAQSFAINPALVDGTATVKRQAATGVIAALTGITRSLTIAQTATVTAGSNVLTGLPQTFGLAPGMIVSGTGIPAGAVVQSVDALTGQVTLDVNATASNAGTALSFGLNGLNITGKSYGGLIAAVTNSQAVNKAAAASDSTLRTTASQTLDTRYNGFVGVNLDKEIAQLTILQNSYAANARVVNVATQMFEVVRHVRRGW